MIDEREPTVPPDQLRAMGSILRFAFPLAKAPDDKPMPRPEQPDSPADA